MSSKDEQDTRLRVARGGGWYGPAADGQVSYRLRSGPGDRYAGLGVRLIRHRSALERLADSLREVRGER